jgi:hypothetical protein
MRSHALRSETTKEKHPLSRFSFASNKKGAAVQAAPFAKVVRGLTALCVVLLVADGAAGAVLQCFDPGAFIEVEATTISAAARFIAGDVGLLTFNADGFARGEVPFANAIGDPLLLMVLPLIDSGLCGHRGCKHGQRAGGKGKIFTHVTSPCRMGVIQRRERTSAENPLPRQPNKNHFPKCSFYVLMQG